MSEDSFDISFTSTNSSITKKRLESLIKKHASNNNKKIITKYKKTKSKSKWNACCNFSQIENQEQFINSLNELGATDIILREWFDSSGTEQFSTLVNESILTADDIDSLNLEIAIANNEVLDFSHNYKKGHDRKTMLIRLIVKAKKNRDILCSTLSNVIQNRTPVSYYQFLEAFQSLLKDWGADWFKEIEAEESGFFEVTGFFGATIMSLEFIDVRDEEVYLGFNMESVEIDWEFDSYEDHKNIGGYVSDNFAIFISAWKPDRIRINKVDCKYRSALSEIEQVALISGVDDPVLVSRKRSYDNDFKGAGYCNL